MLFMYWFEWLSYCCFKLNYIITLEKYQIFCLSKTVFSIYSFTVDTRCRYVVGVAQFSGQKANQTRDGRLAREYRSTLVDSEHYGFGKRHQSTRG